MGTKHSTSTGVKYTDTASIFQVDKIKIPQNTDTSFTFQVDNVEVCQNVPRLTTADDLLTNGAKIKEKREDFSHKGNKEKIFVLGELNGFMSALHTAYQAHYPLKLSVSDFIILIGQGLGKHIDANAEKLRKFFVNHEGKEKIEIRRDNFVMGGKNDWSTVFGDFAEETKNRVKADVYEVVIDDTSVATPTSRIVSEITLMDCMKNYFEYKVMTKCGIPQITLEGSAHDWEKLREKVTKLVEMNKDNCLELNWWLTKLVPVINRICDTAVTRQVDKEFWSGIYKFHDESGGPSITGWITTFYPYIISKYLPLQANKEFGEITTSEIPKQICEVPFVWNYLGRKIPMNFYGGFLGATFDKETFIVQPAHFWSVVFQDDKTCSGPAPEMKKKNKNNKTCSFF